MKSLLLTFGAVGLICAHIVLAAAFALFFAVSYPVFMIGSGVCYAFDRIKRG